MIWAANKERNFNMFYSVRRYVTLLLFSVFLIFVIGACQSSKEESIDLAIAQASDVALVNELLNSEGAESISLDAAQSILDSTSEIMYNDKWGYVGKYAGENSWISLVRYARFWKRGEQGFLDYTVEIDPLYSGYSIFPLSTE